MAQESDFVTIALATAERVLPSPLVVKQGRPLLYEVIVDNKLELTVDPKRPVRGDSAFQTDLCIFEIKKAVAVEPFFDILVEVVCFVVKDTEGRKLAYVGAEAGRALDEPLHLLVLDVTSAFQKMISNIFNRMHVN